MRLAPPLLCLAIALAGFPSAAAPADSRLLRLKIGTFDPLTGAPPLPPELKLAAATQGGIFVVQFDGAATPAALDELRSRAAVLLTYLPEHAYIVRLAPQTSAAIRALPQVRWVGPIQPGWKLATAFLPGGSAAEPTADGRFGATLDLFPAGRLELVAKALEEIGVEVVSRQTFGEVRRFVALASLQQLQRAARIDEVAWVEPLAQITSRNDDATWVVQSNVVDARTIWNHGLHGEGQIVGHIDETLDIDSCFFADPTDNTPGPGHRKVVAYRSSTGTGIDPHGTHTAGTLAGNSFPVNGSLADAGHAYAARIAHANVQDITGLSSTTSNLYEYLELAHADGARVHSNSWGDDSRTDYTTWSRDIDLFSYDYEEDLVVFSISNTPTLRSPENAKNVLAVGASQNGLLAGNYCIGGAGPTFDGRRKPEILAPGCSISSADDGVSCGTRTTTGTSMACPAVAGAGALVRQYLEEGWYPSGSATAADALVPSGALLKAMLLNATVDLSSLAGNPTDQEGWGRVRLEDSLYFAGDVRRLALLGDVRNANGLETGNVDSFGVQVDSSSEPLRFTLVFTEPAAALQAASATVNNLDLRVLSPSGVTYRGNRIDEATGFSLPLGPADPINNVEQIHLASPESGEWLVEIEATSVNQGRQGYAVIATGQLQTGSTGSVRYARHVIDDSGALANGDGHADPGETISLPLSLINLGSVTATGISAEMTSSAQAAARVPQGFASYPDIGATAIDDSIAPHFTVTVAPTAPCGSTVPIDVRAQHSAGVSDSGFRLAIGRDRVEAASTDTPLALPTFSGTPVDSSITIGDSFTVGEVDVTVDIAHADIGELEIELIAPDNTTVILHDRSDSGSSDLMTTYDEEREPDQNPGAMANFNGSSAQGNWRLSVTDAALGIPITPAGTINGWSLTLIPTGGAICSPLDCPGDPTPAAVPATLSVGRENGAEIRLNWSGVPAATAYRIWRADSGSFARQSLAGTTSATTYVDDAMPAAGEAFYYRIHAINSCGWEGP